MAAKKKTNSKRKKSGAKNSLAKVREDLIEQKARIIEEIMSINSEALKKSIKEASGDLSGYSFHMADMATDLYDREFMLELAEGEREMLYSLDVAIKRIDDGSYGECEGCGQSISKQRLKAMPQAINCIKCQQKEEETSAR